MRKTIHQELSVFFTAVMFYSRIPVPRNTGFSPAMLNQATRYFPCVGIITGCFGALVWWMAGLLLPAPLAVLLSMASTILLTGAFHEDGFADFCDGFGGGYTRAKILEIMKDSRIGTYGSIGLVMMLATKYLCLVNIPAAMIPVVFITGHAFSRLLPVCVIYTSDYVRDDALSKAKPIGHRGTGTAFAVAVLFGLIPLRLLPWLPVVVNMATAGLLFWFFTRYIRRKLGGYTGDVLGALQQLTEIVFYLGLIAVNSIPL